MTKKVVEAARTTFALRCHHMVLPSNSSCPPLAFQFRFDPCNQQNKYRQFSSSLSSGNGLLSGKSLAPSTLSEQQDKISLHRVVRAPAPRARDRPRPCQCSALLCSPVASAATGMPERASEDEQLQPPNNAVASSGELYYTICTVVVLLLIIIIR